MTLAVSLLGVALFVGIVAERFVIPSSVALLLAGIAGGALWSGGRAISFGSVLLLVLLPPLLFEAAYSLDVPSLRRGWKAIALLAVPGVVFTAGAIGLACVATQALDLTGALLLGAIVAATDPVAVVAVFRKVGVPVELATLVEGESIANDGTTLLLFQVFLALEAANARTTLVPTILHAALLAPLGGAAIGFALARVVALSLRGTTSRSLMILGTVFTAYGSYLIADRFGLSGIFATATAALALRVVESFPGDVETSLEIDRLWSAIAVVADAFVFLLAGVNLQVGRIAHEPLVVFAALIALAASRAALAYGALPLLGILDLKPSWRHVVALSGIRGALSLALALSLPDDVPGRATIVDVVFAVVVVTLVVQGLAVRPILSRLRL